MTRAASFYIYKSLGLTRPPKGMPKEAVARLNGAMVQALADSAVKTRFADLGLDMAAREQQSPEALAAFHKAETEKWWPIIRAAGIKAE